MKIQQGTMHKNIFIVLQETHN